ncbi:MAG: hypothetical protein N3A69_02860, partial [Leptospiraceae bacterium]|nr:hypothetical protein [Leptospiraceae bacterium]
KRQPLLLGLAVLANQPRYEATVSLVMQLKKIGNLTSLPTSYFNSATLIENANGINVPALVRVSKSKQEGEPDILIIENQKEPQDFTTVSNNADNGDISITFKLNASKGKLEGNVFACRNPYTTSTFATSHPGICMTQNPNNDGKSDYDNPNNYTHKHGSFILNVNLKETGGYEADNPNTPQNEVTQVTIESQDGIEFNIKQVNVSIKGIYNLQNPTVGENVCDGKNVTSTPETLSGDITSNKTISGAAQLQGTVFVKNGATLTVDAGTVVFGNRGSSLFVLPGGKLITKGTKEKPVCFTSSQAPGSRFPGDWGGIVIIGNGKGTRSATTEGTTPQTYGNGNDDNDNSGSLEYTIIEFAGNEVAPGDELNSLSLYTIGSGTKVSYVQVHRGLDDGFEAWGGAVNMDHLVATGGLDDDYDLDEGYAGTIQYFIGHKYPAACGGSPSTDPHGFEMDGTHAGGTCSSGNAARCTNPTLSYFTMIGANIAGGEAARLREGFAGTLQNGIFFGYGATNFIGGANTSGYPNNSYNIQNTVYGESGKNPVINAQSTSAINMTLTSLPITSAGDTEGCGFGSNKPDYTTNTASGAPASVGASGNNAGRWWEGWTVYRAR